MISTELFSKASLKKYRSIIILFRYLLLEYLINIVIKLKFLNELTNDNNTINDMVMYIVFISKFISICPFIKAYIKAPINIIAQRVKKMYGLDKSDILFIATLIQKNNKAIIYYINFNKTKKPLGATFTATLLLELFLCKNGIIQP